MRRLALAAVMVGLWQTRAHATCAAPANAIEAENCLPGSPQGAWDVSPIVGDATIQGFATDISYNKGETAQFKVKTAAANYRLDIYRLGYYGGMGARLVAQVTPTSTPAQPDCVTEAATGLIDCGNWAVTATWAIPANAVSGVYVAKVIRLDTNGASHIPFVVRNDGGSEDILFQTSDTTWQAYNPWGGNSLYIGQPSGSGAYMVSYNRPFTVRGNYPTSLFHQEYPVIRWLEANGYDVAYFTNVDGARRGGEILNHQVFMPVGQQEYWSAEERSAVENARAAGVHLAFIAGVTSLWKTRWQTSIAGGAVPNRTLVCYKETSRGALDPEDPPTWTGMWRDKKLSPTSDGGRPENALTGQSFSADAIRMDTMLVPAEFGNMRFWRNTGVAALSPGQIASFPQVVGMEWDIDADNGSRPAGLVRLSSSTITVPKALLGTLYSENWPITHRVVFYKHSTGSLVFNAGTMSWGWGLDNVHNGGLAAPVQQSMRQATVNLLADMGVQPVSLQPGLVPAAASTDSTPPVANVVTPAGANIGQTQLLTGTASDSGGVVGAVEVSTDNATWHPAEGRTNWRYGWTVTGPSTVRARAIDDSGNIGSPTAPLTITPGAGAPAGPTVAALNPSSAPANGGGFTLTVMGEGFMNGAVVRFNGEDKPTAYMGATTLQATIAPDDVATPGAMPVTVANPGGVTTAQALEFMVIGPSQTQLSQARVYPNPWRADRHRGAPVTFDTLPPSSTIKLFTVSGRYVRTLNPSGNTGTWDLRSDDGETAASGYYLYLITDGTGGQRRGTLALIR